MSAERAVAPSTEPEGGFPLDGRFLITSDKPVRIVEIGFNIARIDIDGYVHDIPWRQYRWEIQP